MSKRSDRKRPVAGKDSRNAAIWATWFLVGLAPLLTGSEYAAGDELSTAVFIQLGSVVVLLLWLVASLKNRDYTQIPGQIAIPLSWIHDSPAARDRQDYLNSPS